MLVAAGSCALVERWPDEATISIADAHCARSIMSVLPNCGYVIRCCRGFCSIIYRARGSWRSTFTAAASVTRQKMHAVNTVRLQFPALK